MSTPLTDGASLSDNEIDIALTMRRIFERFKDPFEALEHLAIYGNVKLSYWDGPCPVCFKTKAGIREIWLLEGDDAFHTCFRFAHEWAHLRFAPAVLAFRDLNRTQISKWEGKADLFASIFVMPLLKSELAEDVYRTFGEQLRRGAHCRLLFFQQQGW